MVSYSAERIYNASAGLGMRIELEWWGKDRIFCFLNWSLCKQTPLQPEDEGSKALRNAGVLPRYNPKHHDLNLHRRENQKLHTSVQLVLIPVNDEHNS
jgi:hypothetical protein